MNVDGCVGVHVGDEVVETEYDCVHKCTSNTPGEADGIVGFLSARFATTEPPLDANKAFEHAVVRMMGAETLTASSLFSTKV